MVKTLSGRLIGAVVWMTIAAVVAGCQQPQTPDDKRARLLAAENIQLKKQVADQQARIESLRKQQAQELSRCQARAEQLQRDLEKGIAERVGDVTTKVVDENARLRKQIESLQSQLKKPKAEPNQP